MTIEIDQCIEVADILGIETPALVEKDYFAVQLLKELFSLEFEGYQIVFAGGTCLAKIYQNLYRMSEDIDIKLVPNEATKKLSRSQQRKLKGNVHISIQNLFKNHELFRIIDKPRQRNENGYQCFQIIYPKQLPDNLALRPEILLEITESNLLEPHSDNSISSLYASAANQNPEIMNAPCVTLKSIASEKFISILRRTAACERDNSKKEDERLIRHIYDLHLIYPMLENDLSIIKDFVVRVIETDKNAFGKQHQAFHDNPIQELLYGLECIINNPIYKKRYTQFIGPLVYHKNPADWNTSLQSLIQLSDKIL